MPSGHGEDSTLEKKIIEAINKYQMQDIYDGAVLAFSGGADSSALLYFLKDKCKNLICVHVNHLIRGDEAMRDEEFAKNICKKYGVKLISERIDIPKIAKENKKGLEETAREERYNILYRVLSKNPQCKCIVTAHNADDNFETVLFNLTRGTGIKGLAGIKPVYNHIMRPLIYSSKSEILEYCLTNGIDYVTDSTNMKTEYSRNLIRHNVIPELKRLNPDCLDAVKRLGILLSQDEAYFEKEIDKIIFENKIKGKIPLWLLKELDFSLASRLLRRVSNLSLDYTAVNSCIELAKGNQAGARIDLLGGSSFKIEHDYAIFLKTDDFLPTDFCQELVSGLNYIKEIDKYISFDEKNAPNGYELDTEIRLDKNKIDATLYVRSRKEGDKIKSGKMTKKLKQIFVDYHIPSHKRDKIPLICTGDSIIAIPDVVVADGYKGNDLTIKIFKKKED